MHIAVRQKKPVQKFLIYLLYAMVAFSTLLPLVWAFFLSFKDTVEIFNTPFNPPKAFDLGLYGATFQATRMPLLFFNTVLLSAITSLVVTVLVFCASFAIIRLNQNYKWLSAVCYFIMIAGIAVPIFTKLFPLYFLGLSISKVMPALGLNSLWGILFPYFAAQTPVAVIIIGGGLRSVPQSLEEAALIDSATPLDIIFRIDLPILKPVVVTTFIFCFLSTWNEFALISIWVRDRDLWTVSFAIAQFKDVFMSDYGGMLRAVLLVLAPQVLIFLFFQKYIVAGMQTAGIKG